MTVYVAYLRQNGDSRYTVEFPDLPDCVTVGEHPGQVSALAGDELVRYLTALMAFGYPAPLPSSEAQQAEDPRRGGAELMAFELDLELLGIAHPLVYHAL